MTIFTQVVAPASIDGAEEAPLHVGGHLFAVDTGELHVHAHVGDPRQDPPQRRDQGPVGLEHHRPSGLGQPPGQLGHPVGLHAAARHR